MAAATVNGGAEVLPHQCVNTCYWNVDMQIIQVNLTSEDLQPIASGTKVEFTYSVTWAPTPIHFSRRFERYLDYKFFEHQVCGEV